MSKRSNWFQQKYRRIQKSPVLKVGLPMIGFAVFGMLFLSESMKIRYLTSQTTMLSPKDIPKDDFSLDDELKVRY